MDFHLKLIKGAFIALFLCLVVMATLYSIDSHADVVTEDGNGGHIVLTDTACSLKVPDLYKQAAENVKAPIYEAEYYESDGALPVYGCWYTAIPTAEDMEALRQQYVQQAQDSPARSPDEDPIKIILLANIFNGQTVETIRLDKFKPLEIPKKKDGSI